VGPFLVPSSHAILLEKGGIQNGKVVLLRNTLEVSYLKDALQAMEIPPHLPLLSTPISTDQTSFLFFLHRQLIHMPC
ncbi:hypothetical protein SB767_31755, partial [Bacillus sp. SIMBA_069]